MKPKRTILEILFPKVRAEVLRLLFTTPQKQRYVRELIRLSGLALCTIQDELRKLTAMGILTSWSDGYHRFYSANRHHPLFSDLLHIVQLSARLPRTKYSALDRRRYLRPRRRRGQRRIGSLPSDRLVKWHLFSRSK